MCVLFIMTLIAYYNRVSINADVDLKTGKVDLGVKGVTPLRNIEIVKDS